MVIYKKNLDSVFHALSNGTRRDILQRIAVGSHSISEIGQQFDLSFPAILKHLRVLEDSGLITKYKNGKVRFFKVNSEKFAPANQWIQDYTKFWNKQFNSLHHFLKS